MNNLRISALCMMVLYSLACQDALGQAPQRADVLIDTDIGADIDDAFAVVLALASEEIQVRGITTVGDDTQQKAMLVCRFLTATGRRHIAVAAGSGEQPKRPITSQYKYYHHPDVAFDRTKKPERQTAVEFLQARLKSSPKTTLVALGPLTNIARLLQDRGNSASRIERIILLESNIHFDVPAAQKVFAAGVPLVVVSADACKNLTLSDSGVDRVFSPRTALTRQVETLYQMWDRHNPPLGEALAVALCIEQQFAESDNRSLVVGDDGMLTQGGGKPQARVVTSVKASEFNTWYSHRMASFLPPAKRPVNLIDQGPMPRRVHVAEDFETDIERRWWMSGKPETSLLPAGSKRACRGVLTHDFDDLLMVSRDMYSAVIYNPVPGPPMGPNTRLSFRYWLKGTDAIRVQIYSLTNGYHRQLVVKGLPQEQWQHATVDMTQARRPDGTGGPLSEGERIDDIQFYVDPDAAIVIDDIVLYDAAREGETRPFPARIIFTAWFDTGAQGREWPGDFKLVDNAGNTGRAAQSVANPDDHKPWIRVGMRGQRALGDKSELSFRCRLKGTDTLQIRLVNSANGNSRMADLNGLKQDVWVDTTAQIATQEMPTADEIQMLVASGGELLVDDLLLYESDLNSPSSKAP